MQPLVKASGSGPTLVKPSGSGPPLVKAPTNTIKE